MNTSRLSSYAPIIVRIGISLVLIYFSWSQFTNPGMWTRVVPEWATGILGDAAFVVKINAWFEALLAFILILGFKTRFFGLVAALHLAMIASTFGLAPTGVRDFGLAAAALSIFFAGADRWSLDRKLASKASVSSVPNQQ